MKKRTLIYMFLVLALGLSACGKKDTAVPADAPAEEVTQEAAASEETPADTTEEAEKTGELPAYKYTGEDPLYAEIDRYVVEEIGSDYAEGQVGIPCNIIIEIDESDDNDIKVWGDFWYFNYDIDGDTLMNVAGGDHPGLMHLKKTGESYQVTSMDRVADGSDYEKSAREIFGDERYIVFSMVHSMDDLRETFRGHVIADYVFTNDLEVTKYQDYGWDPVDIYGTEEGILDENLELEGTEDMYESYSINYGSDVLTAIYEDEEWQIIDSYKVKSCADMELICEKLNEIHTIPASESSQEKTREPKDMTFEWLQHNMIYDILPDDSEWKESTKHVNLNAADQGKTYIEIYEGRTGERFDMGLLR